MVNDNSQLSIGEILGQSSIYTDKNFALVFRLVLKKMDNFKIFLKTSF